MTLDESGYYVRLPGDTTIYQLGADDVQAILAAAESAAAA